MFLYITLCYYPLYFQGFEKVPQNMQKSRYQTTSHTTQPNDTERNTPTERGIKVECLNRFHLISLQR